MAKTNSKQKIKISLASIFIALVMMFTFNSSFLGAMSIFVVSNNFATAAETETVSEDNYVASEYKSFDFVSQSAWSNYYISNSTNNTLNTNYEISGNKSLAGLVTKNNYYPIVKYNGVTTISERRTAQEIDTEIDKLDNFGGVISLNNYQVATKQINNDKFYTVTHGTDEENKIYLKLTSATSSADLTALIEKVNALNTEIGYQKYAVIDQFAEGYSSADYSSVSSDSHATDYTSASSQVADVVETKTEGDSLYQFSLNNYELYLKNTYKFVENYMYLSASNNTVELVNNSYYCMSVWVYTSGEAMATIRIAGTNLDAQIQNISTLGKWVQYNLFIESRGDSSTTARVSLYYGNTDGVTGNRTLESYKTGEDQYETISGTVAFDNIKIYTINYADYQNKTINGKQVNEIAVANIAEGHSIAVETDKTQIKNNSKATDVKVVYLLNASATDETELEALQSKVANLNQKLDYNRYVVINQFVSSYSSDNYEAIETSSSEYSQIIAETNGQVDGLDLASYPLYFATTGASITLTVPKYTYVTYANANQLSSVDYYSARYFSNSLFENSFDTNFDTTTLSTKAQLVENYDDTSDLKFNSYESSSKFFSYYLPRYTSDTSTTNISENLKNVYRDQYYKNSQSKLDLSIVLEQDQDWNSYTKYTLDAFGEKIDTGTKDEDDNIIYQTETAHNNTFANNNKILKLENTSESYDLGVVSAALVVPANALFRISVWAYSNSKDAVATAKLFASVKTKDNLEFGHLQITSGEATDFEFNGNSTNGWKEIVLYVKGNPTSTQKAYLTLIASANDTVYFDNINVESVTSTQFDNGTHAINLSNYGVLSSNINNGVFNNFSTTTEDATATYPYKASNWTMTSEDRVISGIVSTNTNAYSAKLVPTYDEDGNIDYYDADKLSVVGNTVYFDGDEITNYLVDYQGKYVKASTVKALLGNQNAPTTLTGNENVYAIYLVNEKSEFKFATSNGIGYSSSSSSLQSSSVYKLTAQVWFASNFEGKLSLELTYNNDGTKTISQQVVDVESSMLDKWNTFTFYIRTGNTSRSNIKLEFAATEAQGTMFISNVNNITLSESTDGNVKTSVDDKFEALVKQYKTSALQQNALVRFVDLNNNNFTMHAAQADDTTNVFESYSYTKETIADDADYVQGEIGVVNLGTEVGDGFKLDGTTLVQIAPKDGTAENANTALILYNTDDADYVLANALFNNTLSSSSFYKFTVDVYTSAELDEDANQGITIKANGFEDTAFENLNTNGTWKTYTFYFRTGSTTVSNFSLSFALGDTKDGYTGYALVSNMQLSSLEEDEYTTITTDEDVLADKSVVIKSLYKESDSSEEKSSEEKNEFSWQTFFLVFSSILLVVALVIALVAIIVRRKKKKSKTAVVSADSKPDGGIA